MDGLNLNPESHLCTSSRQKGKARNLRVGDEVVESPLQRPAQGESINEKNPPGGWKRSKIAPVRPPKETHTRPPPRCAMQGALVDCHSLDHGKSQQGL